MKYASIFTEGDKKEQFCISFPDLKGCFTCGDTFNEGLKIFYELSRIQGICEQLQIDSTYIKADRTSLPLLKKGIKVVL